MPYAHLLVPTDGSQRSEAAIHHAVALAQDNNAQLTLMHVQARIPMPAIGMGELLDPNSLDTLIQASESDSKKILKAASAIATSASLVANCELVTGNMPHKAIVDMARRLNCDLIVMASHCRRGLEGMLLGSETQRVLLDAPCPVLVYR